MGELKWFPGFLHIDVVGEPLLGPSVRLPSSHYSNFGEAGVVFVFSFGHVYCVEISCGLGFSCRLLLSLRTWAVDKITVFVSVSRVEYLLLGKGILTPCLLWRQSFSKVILCFRSALW